MNYDKLLDFTLELAVRFQKCGAETYRVEETITRLLEAYGVEADASVIPNCITVACTAPDGRTLSTLRRVHNCSTILDGVERYNALSRTLCAKKPELEEAWTLLNETTASIKNYNVWIEFFGYFLVAFGFAIFFKGTILDAFIAGVCGLATGASLKFMGNLHANPFFSTLVSGFILAFFAHSFGHLGICHNADAVTIGTLMILVPGFLFTNSIRDIIYGDTLSGVNRLVQVLIVAAALVVGTSAAVNLTGNIFGGMDGGAHFISYSLPIQCIAGMIGTLGFCLWFNIHGIGLFYCLLGSIFSWLAYSLFGYIGVSEYACYFIAAAIVSLYAEIMARIRKYPATSYLLASLVPLIPGSGVYYAMSAAASGNVELFAEKTISTAAIAGSMAIAILLISSSFRMWGVYKARRARKKEQSK